MSEPMVDTQRFKIGPACVRMVTDVLNVLAQRHGGRTNALEVSSYLPLDVDSVARILDAQEDEGTIRRVQSDDGICHYEVEDPRDVDWSEGIERGAHLVDAPGFMKNLRALREEDEWLRRVREQHEVLHLAAGARHRTIELGYLTSRSEIASARIQSLLNDFAAEGYVDVDYDEDADTLHYTFPRYSYADARYERNMEILGQLEARPAPSQRYWAMIVVAAAVILLIVILTRL